MVCRYPGCTNGLFDELTRSTLYTWFTHEGILREKYLPHVERFSLFRPGTQHEAALSSRLDVVQEICDLLLRMRDGGQSLNAGIIQPIIKGVIATRALELLGDFQVSVDWTRRFVKQHLQWSYRCATTTCGKLPLDWEELGKLMALRVVSLVRAYDIPPELVVNTDQTGDDFFFKLCLFMS